MKNKIELIEKGNKLYVYAPESEKIKVAQEFKDIEGSIPNRMGISGTEFINQIRKETSLGIKSQSRFMILKKRIKALAGML